MVDDNSIANRYSLLVSNGPNTKTIQIFPIKPIDNFRILLWMDVSGNGCDDVIM